MLYGVAIDRKSAAPSKAPSLKANEHSELADGRSG